MPRAKSGTWNSAYNRTFAEHQTIYSRYRGTTRYDSSLGGSNLCDAILALAELRSNIRREGSATPGRSFRLTAVAEATVG